MKKLRFKDVDENDMEALYLWRNHPLVRENSFNTDQISRGEHQQWFKRKITSSQTVIYIAYSQEDQIGMIRFESEEKVVKVNVMLNPDFFGKGFGAELIQQGTMKFMVDHKTDRSIIAEIKDTNVASIKVFQKAGFKMCHLTYIFESQGRN